MNWRIRNQVLDTDDHTLIMGIVNATPDSFSEGGSHFSHQAAVAHGLAQRAEGADIVDVGGESTRPGAEPVPTRHEIDRVVPVVRDLAKQGVVVSVDTMKAAVAAAAIEAGAHIVNDVTALGDPDMPGVCSAAGVGVILMHMQGDPQTMQADPTYDDVVAEVAGYLEGRVDHAIAAGIDRAALCIDPGIGFGKTFDHNLALLSDLGRLGAAGLPVLVGTSRKGFLGAILNDAGWATKPAERDPATAATVALAIAGGASVVRVHNVGHALQAARTADAMVRASQRRK
ncbi:MAG: dihydropteroate synthase [Acidimicrobiia bacterium]|nr:dihydropteroate synthase [Acidimicrobiia bacterium]